jgi:hypothetical protein
MRTHFRPPANNGLPDGGEHERAAVEFWEGVAAKTIASDEPKR